MIESASGFVGRRSRALALAGLLCVAGFAACTNNPYPAADAEGKVLYAPFREAPRTLDPAVAYTTSAHAITGPVFDTLLEYHYLKRPYELIPGLATAVPEPEPLADGGVAYRFELRPGIEFHPDIAFDPTAASPTTRVATMADVAFELARIADPGVNSPVIEPFSNIQGFGAFGAKLLALREADPAFAALPVHEQYEIAGPIEGVQVEEPLGLRIVLGTPYPQILYWFAMPFSTPMAHEIVEYYDGQEGRPRLADHPVGTGPYVLAEYDKQARMVLERNDRWYGVLHPEWQAPGAVYPSEGSEGDAEAGRLDPEMVGRSLPLIERIEYLREKEAIPSFNKFLQGYYDAAGVIKESFDSVIRDGGLSPDMREMGIALEKSVSPSIYYIGFNMDDPTVGRSAGEAGRKLRQAMSLAVDSGEFTRLFQNGRGVPAQSPLPPGIFGYREDYENPYRQPDLARAEALLVEAGYPGGIDPETQKPIANCDIPNDHAITAALYKVAKEQKIDVIISGSNLATESILPFDWGYDAKDSIHLKSVLKKYGRIKSLEDYPVRSVFDFYFKDSYFPAIKSFRILDSVMYTKKEAKDAITSELEWVDYGGKHYESVFTRFFQGYYLPKKFGFDKRKAHLSSLILSGQITRAEALSQLKAEDYSSELKHQDLEFVSKKLGISVEEFETIIDQKPKSFSDYPSFYPIMQFLRKLKALIKKN